MECLHALAPGDEELLNYALDEGPLAGATQEHLEQCAVCQQRLSLVIKLHTSLLHSLYRSQCPSATILSYYCAKLLSPQQTHRVVVHLEICPLCTLEVEQTYQALENFEPFPS